LGKGYATIPSTTNNQLPAQLHYDHHFCKIQMLNKEQRHVDDLLANSLVSIETKKKDIVLSELVEGLAEWLCFWYRTTKIIVFEPRPHQIENDLGQVTNGYLSRIARTMHADSV
jgi:hypothetical protein